MENSGCCLRKSVKHVVEEYRISDGRVTWKRFCESKLVWRAVGIYGIDWDCLGFGNSASIGRSSLVSFRQALIMFVFLLENE